MSWWRRLLKWFTAPVVESPSVDGGFSLRAPVKEKRMGEVNVTEMASDFFGATWDHWKAIGGESSHLMQEFFKSQAERAAEYTKKFAETKDQQWLDNLMDLEVQSELKLAQQADHLEDNVQQQAAKTIGFLSKIAKAAAKAIVAALL